MPQQVRHRQQKTIEYSQNNKVSESLGRGMIYRDILLHLTSQPTIAAVDNTAANTLKGDDWAVVKKVQIIANATDVIREYSGVQLWWLNYFLYGPPPRRNPTLGDGATANPSLSSVLRVPFTMPNSIRPFDTAFDSRKLSDLKVEVTWGSHTDINASATGFTTDPQITVHSIESFGVSANSAFATWKHFPIEKTITANEPKFEINLPISGMYRGFLINTEVSGADNGNVLNNFKLISGANVFADVSEEVLQDDYPQRNALQRGFTGSSYDDLMVGNANSIDGWYFYDHVTDGLNSEAIDTVGLSELKLELDVSVGGGTTKLYVVPMNIIPVRGAPAPNGA